MVLEKFVPLLQMSSGRRISVLKQMRQLAHDMGLPTLVSDIDRALDHDLITREYDNRWAEPARRSLYTPEVAQVDRFADVGLSSIRDVARAQVRGLPESDPLVLDASAMLDDIFPAGVAAVTSLPFVDEVAACEVIVAKLRGRWASVVVALGLEQRVTFLGDYTTKYRQVVDQRRNLTFATVQKFRQRGQQLMRELVVTILGLYSNSEDPAQVAARDRLLEPLVVQLDDIRARNRARRANGADDEEFGDEAPEVGDGEPGDGAGEPDETGEPEPAESDQGEPEPDEAEGGSPLAAAV